MAGKSRIEPTLADAVARIHERAPVLNAFVRTRLDDALAQARAHAGRSRSRLSGAPFSLKDAWDTTLLPTTGGSHRHYDREPERSSLIFDAFDRAGAVLVGKTNLSDLSLAPEASSFVGGPTRNPHDLERTAGGSSGGAAAAVADGMVAFDWGTDIGGSIRCPAAYCGVLGLRLSSSTWPVDGMFPPPPASLSWMNGQGPIAPSVEVMRAVLEAAAPTMRTGSPGAFVPRGLVIYAPSRPGKWRTFPLDAAAALSVALELPIEPCQLPPTNRVQTVYASLWASHFEDLLACDESLSLGEGLRAVVSSVVFRGRFGDRRIHPTTAELLALIAIGRFTLFRNPAKARRNARAIRDAFDETWDQGHVIVAPTVTFPAPKIGRVNRNPQLLSCVVPGNVTDATAISIPFGRFGHLPRGLQLMGPPGSEQVLLDLAERLLAKDR